MAINRRELLQALTAVTLTAGFVPQGLADTKPSQDKIIGASTLGPDQYALSCVDLSGQLQWQTSIPCRGHAIALHPEQELGVLMARRPGQLALLFDTRTGVLVQQILIPEHLAVNGHALWSGDRLVVCTGRRDTSQMTLLAYQLAADGQLYLEQEVAYPYLGPHETVLYEDRLWIAVGGLQTDGRTLLNRGDFNSALVAMSASTLRLQAEYPAPAAGLSLRHLVVDSGGTVYIAGQYQLDVSDSPCLLYVLDRGALQPLLADALLWPRLQGYIGSIALVDDQLIVASPKANWLGWFDKTERVLAHQYLVQDVCALANSRQGLVAGSGTGRLYLAGQLIDTNVAWDNHFVACAAP